MAPNYGASFDAMLSSLGSMFSGGSSSAHTGAQPASGDIETHLRRIEGTLVDIESALHFLPQGIAAQLLRGQVLPGGLGGPTGLGGTAPTYPFGPTPPPTAMVAPTPPTALPPIAHFAPPTAMQAPTPPTAIPVAQPFSPQQAPPGYASVVPPTQLPGPTPLSLPPTAEGFNQRLLPGPQDRGGPLAGPQPLGAPRGDGQGPQQPQGAARLLQLLERLVQVMEQVLRSQGGTPGRDVGRDLPDTRAMTVWGGEAGNPQGWAQGSPSINDANTTGANGAGGWSHGSSYNPRTRANTFLEGGQRQIKDG